MASTSNHTGQKIYDSIGANIASIETFPASEGFIAFQDSQDVEGLLLNTNSGIYFQFIRTSEMFSEKPEKLSLKDVKVGENYALIINNNAGLWGDTTSVIQSVLSPPIHIAYS